MFLLFKSAILWHFVVEDIALLLLLNRFNCVWLSATPWTEGSPPGILQARTLEWIAISFSNTWKWKVKMTSLSRVQFLATPWTAAYQAPPSKGFSRQEYWSGLSLTSPSRPSTLMKYTVQFSCSFTSNSLWPHGLQHARLPCSSLTPRTCSNLCPSSQWCHPTISSSVVPFSCLQSFLAAGSFTMSEFLVSGDQSIGVSVSASVLPLNIQDWFPLEWTAWISLRSERLSRVSSNTIVQKHQFFGAQIS